MRKVRLSTNAKIYLTQEAKYLRDRNGAAAAAFVARMRHARELLAKFPELGTGKKGLPHSDMRCLVVGDYLLDYQIRGEEILILAIRHGRQLEISIELDDARYDDDTKTPKP
jgi:plasmid stabilization system protein ParE